MMKMRLRAAFTMIEMVIVIALIGAIMTFILPKMMKYMGKTEEAKIKFKLTNIQEALNEYRMELGAYPNTKEGLQALIKNPRPNDAAYAGKRNKWPFIQEDQIVDLKGEEFTYSCPPVKNKNLKYYELMYLGPSGSEEDKEAIIIGQ